jgi:hypothetical protein
VTQDEAQYKRGRFRRKAEKRSDAAQRHKAEQKWAWTKK